MNISIFIHAAILPGCKERILQYLNIIKSNNLILYADIIICFVGDGELPITPDEINSYSTKILLVRVSNNLTDYELPTLQYIYNYCNNNLNNYILYIHTKHIGQKHINICIEDQIEYMLYFLISTWEKCVSKLQNFNTCGVDLRNEPTLHYSGNFWWANSNYICQLPSPTEFNCLYKYPNPLNSLRHNQEFWICFIKTGHNSLWDCNINVYERHLHRYENINYII